MAQSVNVMNVQIKGDAVIRHALKDRSEADIQALKLDLGISDDDLSWGLVAFDSNMSSILEYGQTDKVVSSEYIVDHSQMIAILDWNLKYGKDPKHAFEVDDLPFLAFVQPGATMTFGLTDLGFSALVEVSEYSHRITPGGAHTAISMLEIPAEWNVSSAASVREVIAAPVLSSGGIGSGQAGAATLGQNLVVSIGAAGSSLPVDIQCDLDGDSTDINAAMSLLSSTGTMYFVGGRFVISSPIALRSGITLDIDPGATLEGSGDGYVIEAFGTRTTHLSSIAVVNSGRITHGNSTASSAALVHFEYADDWLVDAVRFSDSPATAIEVYSARNGKFSNTFVKDCKNAGVLVTGSQFIVASGVSVQGCSTGIAISQDVPGDVDHVVQGGYEAGGANWGAYFDSPTVSGLLIGNNVSLATSSSIVYEGAVALEIKKIGVEAYYQIGYDGTYGIYSAMNGFVEGRTYYFSHRFYRSTSSTYASAVNGFSDIVQYSTNGSSFVTLKGYDLATLGTSAWVLASFSFTVPSNLTGFRVVVSLGASLANDSLCYVDSLQCIIKSDLNSGLRAMNSNVMSCVNGISVAGSRNRVQGCHVEGCSGKGIWIRSGLQNAVMDNEAFDNGADTGPDNTNTDNFLDDGVSTMVGDNTWD
jgi:hypothetical protein